MLEPGEERGETRRLAGRVMARRDMGKLAFLDLVDRSGRIQLLVRGEKTGAGRPRPRRRDRRLGHPGADEEGRALAGRGDARAAREEPQAAARHLPRPSGRRDPVPAALPRPARQRGVARGCAPAHARGDRDQAIPRRARLRRGRDADPAAALRRRLRRAVRHPLQRARRRLLPPDRDRALPQAPDRRRAREGLRDRQGLSQRGHLVQAPARVHDARVVRGVRRLSRHDGSHGAARRVRRTRGQRHDQVDVSRTRGRLRELAEVEARRRARGARALDARRRRAAHASRPTARSTRSTTRRGHSSSTTRSSASSSRR